MRRAWTVSRWLATRVVGPVAAALAWTAFVWFTGRTWRHHVTRRWVRREVRAAGNWLTTAAAAALIWRPVVTGLVLLALGAALIGTAATTRRRAQLPEVGQSPIRVRATVGPDQRLTTSGGGR